MTSVPEIDISALLSAPRIDSTVADAVGAACRDVGFFTVVGHGVDSASIATILDAARWYFARPDAEKVAETASPDRPWGYIPVRRRHAQDKPGGTMESYRAMLGRLDSGVDATNHDPDRWPPSTWFRQVVGEHHDAMTQLCRRLLHAFAVALGLPADRFDEMFRRPQTTLQLTRYRGVTDTVERGLAPHRDLGAFTVLVQDGTPGLEISDRSGAWQVVEPIGDGLTVNIGDWMETWSGGRFRSTLHRATNRSPVDRYSVPFFMIPDRDAWIRPLPELPPLTDTSPDPFECGAYLDSFYAEGLREVTQPVSDAGERPRSSR